MSGALATGDWHRGMLRASSLLASGCFLLLIGSFVWIEPDWFIATYLLSVSAILIHLAAWIGLGRTLWRSRRQPALDKPIVPAPAISAFVASLVGFSIGIATLPLAFPTCGWFCPAWAYVLLLGLFPYVPTVFGPVVAAQGAMFIIAGSTVQDRLARILILGGSAYLAALATIAMAAQLFFAPSFTPWIVTLSGLGVFGYTATAFAWLRASRRANLGLGISPRSSAES